MLVPATLSMVRLQKYMRPMTSTRVITRQKRTRRQERRSAKRNQCGDTHRSQGQQNIPHQFMGDDLIYLPSGVGLGHGEGCGVEGDLLDLLRHPPHAVHMLTSVSCVQLGVCKLNRRHQDWGGWLTPNQVTRELEIISMSGAVRTEQELCQSFIEIILLHFILRYLFTTRSKVSIDILFERWISRSVN